jgi:hypothetical protein
MTLRLLLAGESFRVPENLCGKNGELSSVQTETDNCWLFLLQFSVFAT